MAFWAAEVEAGVPYKVKIDKGKCLCLSQATLGVIVSEERRQQHVISFFTCDDGKKIGFSRLHPKSRPNDSLELLLCKDTEISHSLEHGSVLFYGNMYDKVAVEQEEKTSEQE